MLEAGYIKPLASATLAEKGDIAVAITIYTPSSQCVQCSLHILPQSKYIAHFI